MTSWFTAIARMIGAHGEEGRPALADRLAAYDAWQAYYDNAIYEPLSSGGQREQVNATLGNASAADLAGLYNPVAEVVDLYQHVYGGAFRPSDAKEDEDEPTDIRAEPGTQAHANLLPALDRIWGWSNLNVSKQALCRLPALHGTAGLRIVAEAHPDPARRRVYLKPEHPRVIRDVELDSRGNVIDIELEYEMTTGIGDDQEIVTIRERLTKEEFRTYKVEGRGAVPFDLRAMQAGGPLAVYPNALGVVPYVLVQHQASGEAFGLNCFYRARSAIDRVNALSTHINTQVFDHVKVDWFIAADGPAPSEVNLTGRRVIYVDTSRSTKTPTIEPMVAPLNLNDAITKARLDIELIEDRLPELKAVVGKFLAGQSGETIAQLRAPAEHRLGLARASYEDALIRASQIALSWGILLGLWELGTGRESREAADTAYRSGAMDHHLNRRPLLPPVAPQAKTQPAQAPTRPAPERDPAARADNAAPDEEGRPRMEVVPA